MKFNEMSPVQKRRLAGAMETALSVRRRLYLTHITGGCSPDEVLALADEVTKAEDQFSQLVNLRGLLPGDRVRILARNGMQGAEAKILEPREEGRFLVEVPGAAPFTVAAADVRMVQHATKSQRPRRKVTT